MLPPRRFLPSLALLKAFEAAARTASITIAAKELNLTQGAVSRQIKALEQQLEVQLFVRERQTIRLTLAGQSYATEIRAALHRITTASLNLRANPYGGALNVAVVPAFGERWLAPRVTRFAAAHPSIMLNLMTRIRPVDFRQEGFDASICFGEMDRPGVQAAALRSETVVPMCSPTLRRRFSFKKPADLREAPLLHLTTRPDAWEHWFARNGAPDEDVHGMLFDQFGIMARSAMAGLGVALLPTFLFEAEVQAGQLVPALNLPMQAQEHYSIVWPLDRSSYEPLVAFRDWLLAEVAADSS